VRARGALRVHNWPRRTARGNPTHAEDCPPAAAASRTEDCGRDRHTRPPVRGLKRLCRLAFPRPPPRPASTYWAPGVFTERSLFPHAYPRTPGPTTLHSFVGFVGLLLTPPPTLLRSAPSSLIPCNSSNSMTSNSSALATTGRHSPALSAAAEAREATLKDALQVRGEGKECGGVGC
jgi:hypothetical protein